MPPVFGGAPTCPRCEKAVYFAEQTLGPGGVAYHKLCLKCTQCGKLLEPRLLVDHDGEAYCKPCHSKAFGAKGYGAGGALVGEYAPRAPSNASPIRRAAPPPIDEDEWASNPRMPQTAPKPVVRAKLPPPVPAPAAPEKKEKVVNVATPQPDEPAATLPDPSTLSLADSPQAGERTPVSPGPAAPTSAPSLPDRPIPPAIAPKPAPPTLPPKPSRPSFSSSATPTAPPPALPTRRTIPSPSSFGVSAANTASPSRPAAASANLSPSKDLCRRCGTIVYFAEEVRAVGAKWHKRCLRCTSCSTALAPNALNERDGAPFCKRCYGEKWGLGGHGVMSRPNLY